MTREEFIAKYERECSYYFDGYYAPCIQEFLNQIYDNFEEAMKHKTCDGCKWEQETKIIKTNIGDKIDICKLCSRYENLQDHYEPKDNA